eukprot:108252-Pelagomonas_calceolata.AAC.3
MRGLSNKTELERARLTESTARAKGRQAEHTRRTRVGLLHKRSENSTTQKGQEQKALLTKTCKGPKKGKDGHLIA